MIFLWLLCSGLVQLDLSTAFDTADHNILLNRLKGLAGISAYLSDRTFSVNTNKLFSITASLSCGVLQGSILGLSIYSFNLLPLVGIIQSFKYFLPFLC